MGAAWWGTRAEQAFQFPVPEFLLSITPRTRATERRLRPGRNDPGWCNSSDFHVHIGECGQRFVCSGAWRHGSFPTTGSREKFHAKSEHTGWQSQRAL